MSADRTESGFRLTAVRVTSGEAAGQSYDARSLSQDWKTFLKKLRSDNLTINSAQFIRSLQPVLAMPAFKKAEAKQVATVLDAYWKGIAQVMPEPFEASADPKKYVIQKGPGAIAFHRVLPQVVEVLRGRGERLGDPDAYARALKDLPTLSGEIVTEDGDTRIVTGANFWKAGPPKIGSHEAPTSAKIAASENSPALRRALKHFLQTGTSWRHTERTRKLPAGASMVA